MSAVLDEQVSSTSSRPPHADRASASRAVDLLVALGLLIVFAPALAAAALWLLAAGGPVLRGEERVGRGQRRFRLLAFAVRPRWGCWIETLHLRRLPVLWNIVRGDLALVGPRPLSPDDSLGSDPEAQMRSAVRPGLVCLWWLRSRANIAYGSELDADGEYAAGRSLRGDLGILLRAIPALLLGGPSGAQSEPAVLGLRIDNLTLAESVSEIVRRIEADAPSQVCFLNADCVNLACRNPEYRETLRRADLMLADGIGIRLAGTILGFRIRQNVNGTDLFPSLCRALSGTGKGIFLLGAKPGVADDVARWVAREHPGVTISGCRHGYFSAAELDGILDDIRRSSASVLLVAFGAPRQDVWIRQHLARTGVKVAMGVGGLFDFYSGRIPRAPLWMRELCLEWLYRLYQEPGRLWRRYLVGNAVFLLRMLRERWRRD